MPILVILNVINLHVTFEFLKFQKRQIVAELIEIVGIAWIRFDTRS